LRTTLTDRKKFIIKAIRAHLGLLGVWLLFIILGIFFTFIGNKVESNGLGFIIFGILFIILSSAFMLFTLPSSIRYYYNQAEIKKYGSYTTAKITNKRIDNYSHNNSSFGSKASKEIKEFLYVIEFEFIYNNKTYKNECFFEHKSTFENISFETELPIKFLKNNPKKTFLRRRKLSYQIGIPEKMCQ